MRAKTFRILHVAAILLPGTGAMAIPFQFRLESTDQPFALHDANVRADYALTRVEAPILLTTAEAETTIDLAPGLYTVHAPPGLTVLRQETEVRRTSELVDFTLRVTATRTETFDRAEASNLTAQCSTYGHLSSFKAARIRITSSDPAWLDTTLAAGSLTGLRELIVPALLPGTVFVVDGEAECDCFNGVHAFARLVLNLDGAEPVTRLATAAGPWPPAVPGCLPAGSFHAVFAVPGIPPPQTPTSDWWLLY